MPVNIFDDLVEPVEQAQEKKNIFDDIVEEQHDAQRRAMLGNVTRQESPDSAADVIQLSNRTGLPANSVQDDIEGARAIDRMKSLDADALMKDAPATSRALASPSGIIVRDEVDKLRDLELSVRQAVRGTDPREKTVNDYMKAAAESVYNVSTQFADIFRRTWVGLLDLTGALTTGVDTLQESTDSLTLRGISSLADLIGADSVAEFYRGYNTELREARKTDAYKATHLLPGFGAAVDAAQDFIDIPPERSNYVTDVARGVGQLGGQIALHILAPPLSILSMLGMGAEQQSERIDRHGEDGTISEDVAVLAGAAVTAISEKTGLDLLLNRVPPAIKNAVLRRLVDVLLAGGIEAAEETIEAIGHNAVAMLYDPQSTLLEGLGYEQGVAFGAGSVGRMLVLGLIPGRHSVAVRSEIERAQQTEQMLRDIQQKVGDLKFREKVPQILDEYIKQIVDEGGEVNSVYVNAGKLDEYFQTLGGSLDDVADAWGIRDLNVARQSNGDVVIPFDRFISQVVTSDHFEAVLDDVRFRPTDWSLRDVKEWEKSYEENLQRQVQEALENEQRIIESELPADRIYQAVLKKLVNVGYSREIAGYQAAVHRAFARTFATRYGLDMEAVYNQYNLNIEHVLAKELQAKNVDDVGLFINKLRNYKDPGARKVYGPSLLEYLAELGGLQDEGGELSARDMQLWHRDRPGSRKLVNEGGLSLDAAIEKARDAGYLVDNGQLMHDDLLELIDRELRGEQVYAPGNIDERARDEQVAMTEAYDYLAAQGIDLNTATDDELRAVLRGSDEYDQNGELVTDSDAFRAWFGDSKVVDYDGAPMVVYHGTTRDFGTFTSQFGNLENSMGVAHYFSDSIDDINTNYAGEGPDLTIRIDRIKEQAEYRWENLSEDERQDLLEKVGHQVDEDTVLDEMEYDSISEEIRDAVARQMAIDELGIEGGGLVMPVYLKMENPFVISSKAHGVTQLSAEPDMEYYEQAVVDSGDISKEYFIDEDGDFDEDAYNDELREKSYQYFYEDYNPKYVGNAGDLVGALNQARGWVNDDSSVEAIDDVIMRLQEGSIDGAQFYELLKNGLAYEQDDETGDLNSHDIIRRIIEEAGFDGVIMYAANHFQNMKDIYDADHYIVFNSNQIKSVFNRGTFDPNDPRILYQHEQESEHWKRALNRMHPSRLDFEARMQLPAALKAMGVTGKQLSMPTRVYLKVTKDHPDIPVSVLENLPALMSDPLYIYSYGYQDGLNVVIDATTEAGEPIIVGVRDGRIRTATPRHNSQRLTGIDSVLKDIADAAGSPGKLYARNDEALNNVRASSQRQDRNNRGRPTWRRKRIVTRDALVKQYGDTFFQTAENPVQAEPAPIFYSEALQAATGLKQAKGTPEQMVSMLKKAGVKQEELDELGIEAAFAGQKSVTQQELIDYINANQVVVEEVLKGQPPEGGVNLTHIEAQAYLNTIGIKMTVLDYLEGNYSDAGSLDWTDYEVREPSSDSFEHHEEFYRENIDEYVNKEDFVDEETGELDEAAYNEEVDSRVSDFANEAAWEEANSYPEKYLTDYSIEGDDIKIVLDKENDVYVLYLGEKYIGEYTNEHYAKDAAVKLLQENGSPILDRYDIEKLDSILEDDGDSTQFANWKAIKNGGENYRELLLTLTPDHTALEIDLDNKRKRAQKAVEGLVTMFVEEGGVTQEEAVSLMGVSSWREGTSIALSQSTTQLIRQALGTEVADKLFDEQAEAERQYKEAESRLRKADFKGGHFSEPNVLVHIRFDERTDADGNRVLLIQEIQSDWHHKGKDDGYRGERTGEMVKKTVEQALADGDFGLSWNTLEKVNDSGFAYGKATNDMPVWVVYKKLPNGKIDASGVYHDKAAAEAASVRQEGVPDAPFKKTWHALALKRMLRWAAEHDFAKLAWATGGQSADLYNVRQYVSKIYYSESEHTPGYYFTGAEDTNGRVVENQDSDGNIEHLAGVYGKDIAQRIKEGAGEEHPDGGRVLTGLNLETGGEYHKFLYDNKFPQFVKKYTKKWGAKVGVSALSDTGVDDSTHGGLSEGQDPESIGLREIPRDEAVKMYKDGDRGHIVIGVSTENGWNLVRPGEYSGSMAEKVMPERYRYFLSEAPKGQLVHAVDITPEMRQHLVQPQPLFQQTITDKRGSIQFGNDETIIRLTESRNLSTFLHESGHLFLDMIQNLATQPGAHPELQAEWQRIKRFLGASDTDKLTTEHHEKWATSFELYLRNGKAPSEELRGPFARFKHWLKELYKSIRHLLRYGAEDTKEITDIFDRLLATDDEIAAARQSMRYKPILREKPADMPDDQWQEYLASAERAGQVAHDQLERKLVREANRAQQDFWKEEQAKVRKLVEQELLQQPVYQALRFLQYGEDGETLKLDRQAIVDMYGEEALKLLPGKGKTGIYRHEGGVHPDVIADRFGYTSGDQLMREIMNAHDFKKLVDAETEARMKSAHGDMLHDGTATEEALAAAHNDEQARFLETELRILSRYARGQDMPANVARRIARDMIGAMRVADITRIHQYRVSEEKAARRAEEAMLRGDMQAAAQAKREQLINFFIFKEAKAALDEHRKILKTLKRLESKHTRKGIDRASLAQIDNILERYDIKPRTQKDLQEREDLVKHLARLEEAGDVGDFTDLDPAIINDLRRTHYTALTMDEFRALNDTVNLLVTTGRNRNKILLEGEKLEADTVAAELINALSHLKQRGMDPIDPKIRSNAGKVADNMRDLDITLLRTEQLIDILDGGRPDGPWRKYIWQQVADAAYARQRMDTELTIRLIEILENKTGKRRLRQRYHINGINQEMTVSGIMSVALNVGNKSNLDKMMRGMTWSESTVQEILSHLTQSEWDVVQEIWDTINSKWQDISDIEFELSGVRPKKIEAMPVQTPFGVYRGGYFPMMYNPRLSAAGMKQHEADLKGEGFKRPSVSQGFVKERIEGFTAPLLFDLDMIPSHISKVTHMVTHKKVMRNLWKLLERNDVHRALNERMGHEYYQQLVRWVNAIADNRLVGDPVTSWWASLLEGVRLNATVVYMGAKFTTFIAQTMGYFSALELFEQSDITGKRMGANYFAKGLRKVARHPLAAYEVVTNLSDFMRDRMRNIDRDVRENYERMMGHQTLTNSIRKYALMSIGIGDMMVALPTWYGAYMWSIDQGMTTQQAIKWADRAVSLSQGGGGFKDLSAVQRNKYLKWATMFMGYFSAYYGRQRSIANSAMQGKSFEAMLRAFLLVSLPAVLGEIVAGRLPDCELDDFDCWTSWALRKQGSYMFAGVPLARDIASYVEGDYGYDMSPLANAFKTAGDVFRDTAGYVAGDKEIDKLAKTTLRASGFLFGLPTSQLEITAGYMYDILSGNEDEFYPQYLLYRRPKDH